MGDESEPLNVDSDRAAAYLAIGSKADAVVFLTDVNGLLLGDRLVERLSASEAKALVPRIGFGMQKKILAGVEAIEAGVPQVIIASGFAASPLRSALAHDRCTVITATPRGGGETDSRSPLPGETGAGHVELEGAV
jgi:acetylglutamate/LysW-gamma-L-alpha-aminoadipate kinase